MTCCMQAAIKAAKFGSDGITVTNLFMVNEAEAAAMNAL